VRGRTARGEWRQEVTVPAAGEGRRCLGKLFGREQVEDLETRVAAGEPGLDPEIERIGLAVQIATRLTSWVAISDEPMVDPGQPTRRIRIPQELPHVMSVEGLGLRSAAMPAMAMLAMAGAPFPVSPAAAASQWMATRAQRGGVFEGSRIHPSMGVSIISDSERRFAGRIAAREGRKLTIELTAIGPDLDWRTGATVEVVDRDGRRGTASVVESTAAGTVSAGQPIRLVIELPSDIVPLEVVISGGPDRVIIVL
jgi:hypothetical protein